MFKTKITGSGAYIPEEIKTNRDFTAHDFYTEDFQRITTPPTEVVTKFQEITGIQERRYAPKELNASDLAYFASKLAIEDAGIDPETLDQIIFAHNFGIVHKHHIQSDAVPSLGSRLKQKLALKNASA